MEAGETNGCDVRTKRGGQLTNGDLAELLAAEAENASYPMQRALRKAGRAAFLWPREAAGMAQEQQPLTELRGVGPYIERLIIGWLQEQQSLTELRGVG